MLGDAEAEGETGVGVIVTAGCTLLALEVGEAKTLGVLDGVAVGVELAVGIALAVGVVDDVGVALAVAVSNALERFIVVVAVFAGEIFALLTGTASCTRIW